jgi:hypothetical protein
VNRRDAIKGIAALAVGTVLQPSLDNLVTAQPSGLICGVDVAEGTSSEVVVIECIQFCGMYYAKSDPLSDTFYLMENQITEKFRLPEEFFRGAESE